MQTNSDNRSGDVKVGLLGYGFMGAVHLAALQRMPGVTVAALASRKRPSADDPPRGNLKLERAALPESLHWTSDWREVIADPAIDAIDICLPTPIHREVVLAAFAAGKHVLCEKPMALSLDDCEVMMQAARDSGRTFMIAQVLRFMAPYRHAETFVQQANSTAIRRCIFRRSTGFPQWGGWLTDQANSGGAILDLLVHDLDLALLLFGEPQSLRATSIGPVDTMRAVLNYEDGKEVVVEGGWLTSDKEFSANFEIETSHTSLLYAEDILRLSKDGVTKIVEVPKQDAYYDEIAYFIECCRRNATTEQCPPEASALAVKLALQLRDSRDAGGKEIAWKQ